MLRTGVQKFVVVIARGSLGYGGVVVLPALSRGSEWSVRGLGAGLRFSRMMEVARVEAGVQRTDSKKERRQSPGPPARAKSYSMVQCGGGVR